MINRLSFSYEMKPKDSYHPKIIFFLLTIITGILILSPSYNFQPLLAQGDHGRDLYCFKVAWDGQLPFKDYWWVYGPLMPYYYGIIFKILGIKIQSILIGKIILMVLSGVFIYLALSLFIPYYVAIMAAIWFWVFNDDFFYTYNHVGGITFLMALIYCLFRYIRQPKVDYLYWGLVNILILSLIKINIGLSALGSFVIFLSIMNILSQVPLTGSMKRIFFLSFVGLPLIMGFIYWALLHPLPLYAIRQCLPYLDVDHPYNTPVLKTTFLFLKSIFQNMISNWPNSIFGFIIIVSSVKTITLIFSKSTDKQLRNNIFFAVLLLVIFYLAAFHEFAKSGVVYRTYWPRPFSILLIFLVIAIGTQKLSRWIRGLLYVAILCLAGLNFYGQYQIISHTKTAEHYLSLERGKVFLGNNPEWIDTVQNASNYLMTHLKKEETFFALPYDPLYYYLTDKKSPTRQSIFFEHINIPPEQEEKIISELENKNVNYVLLSSRAYSTNRGLGFLGRTYCPILGKYIYDHFEPIATFGDWQNPPGWAWNHGVKILKRKAL